MGDSFRHKDEFSIILSTDDSADRIVSLMSDRVSQSIRIAAMWFSQIMTMYNTF